MGCLLAVFVPYETAGRLRQHLTGSDCGRVRCGRGFSRWGSSHGPSRDELQGLAAGTLSAAEP